jgi:hypothetical protein
MFTFGNRAALVLVTAVTLSLNTFNTSAARIGGGGAPANFRVVSKTAYTATLAWDPVTRFGDFKYHLWGAYGVPSVVLPKTATSYTFTGLFPGNYYTFGIYTRDAFGRASEQATVNNVRLPNDTTPPTSAPILSIDEVGSNYANLSWIPAQDDGPHLSTQIYLNGAFYAGVGRGITNITLRFLEPGTTYSLTARAIDFGNNAGPFSDPIALTTPPPNPADVTPPTTPTNLRASGTGDGSTETHARWTQSIDDFDDQINIRYDVHLNGVLVDVMFGRGGTSIFYSERGENVIEVYAIDTAGNVSEPAVTTIFFP